MWPTDQFTCQPLTDISIISAGCKLVTRVTESEVGPFTVETQSVIRGYNIYKEVWSSIIGEVLVYHCDT